MSDGIIVFNFKEKNKESIALSNWLMVNRTPLKYFIYLNGYKDTGHTIIFIHKMAWFVLQCTYVFNIKQLLHLVYQFGWKTSPEHCRVIIVLALANSTTPNRFVCTTSLHNKEVIKFIDTFLQFVYS